MSDKKDSSSVKFKTSIGGQALIEGIMMLGPEKRAIVCRGSGEMVEKVEKVTPLKAKSPVLGLPLIRGVAAFISSMVNGVKALSFSADQLPEDMQEEPDKIDLWIEKHFSNETAQKLIIGVAVVLGIALSLFLFLFLPTFIVGLFPAVKADFYWRTLLEGILKLVIFFIYLILCSKMKDMKRLFAYHGAEHKTIFCYEKGLPLTVENVRPQPRLHPRCGTSFIFVVIIISIIAGSFIHVSDTLLRMGLKFLMLPLIVGLSYELNRWVGRHDNICSAILSWPGKQFQRITTNEPDDEMIECAIRALELVIPEEKGSDAW
ncbi:uncharacterized protein BN556_00621 [Firmicutes bacterium CAG:240]|jgi:uncharacterized protein YqhQ|nr:DUF1385 domain-containing protein [Oscillospiraceae bacterium]OLA42309.1 MAG: hypothetical protein BHW36_06870 [Firmicutes bacterium CAG:24053_14]CDB43106.1 uncharacterized protein BN556_00621 [Firmicutes bacterium CAG:240]